MNSYSARLEVASTEIAVLSGTVFNDILLWGLTREQCQSPTTTTNGRERERIRLTLSGHEVYFILYSCCINILCVCCRE